MEFGRTRGAQAVSLEYQGLKHAFGKEEKSSDNADVRLGSQCEELNVSKSSPLRLLRADASWSDHADDCWAEATARNPVFRYARRVEAQALSLAFAVQISGPGEKHRTNTMPFSFDSHTTAPPSQTGHKRNTPNTDDWGSMFS